MKANLKCANIRGSIFVPKVIYNTENLDKMRAAFTDYMPNVIAPMAIPSVIPNFGPIQNTAWRLISPDQSKTISFYDEKIDIIVNAVSIPYSVEEINKWSQLFFESFKKITDAFGFTSIRLALAPTLYLPIDGTGNNALRGFLNRIFAFNQFKGSELDNCDFSQVFRVNRQLKEKEYTVNHLTKFSSEFYQEQKGNTILAGQRLAINVDINTYVNPQYKFGEGELRDFYEQAPIWCEELMDSYFPDANN